MLQNGCYGSALTAQAASDTCQECPERAGCFEIVAANADLTVERAMVRMAVRSADTDDREKVAAKIARYLSKALLPPRAAPVRNMKRVDGLRVKIAEVGVDLKALSKRQNPFSETRDGPLFLMAELVCEGVPFTPKDMAEHLHDRGCSLKKSSIASEVSRFIALLVEEGILLKKERHIVCLA